MKRICIVLVATVAIISTTSCRRSSDDVLNDTKTAGRHMKRGVRTLGGKHGDSRQVRSRADFASDPKNSEYVSLEGTTDIASHDHVPQPRETPGELGSSLPGIEAFIDPRNDSNLSGVFKNMHFEYNDCLIRGDENMKIAASIGRYMKKHPSSYVFVEGHCDKRGPAAYNLALGANRANAVRSLLINEGVNPDHIFTISYGKEKPIVDGDSEMFYQLNRRAQFRVLERP